ncbi:MAG TPA: Ig-like domain-containing protein [Gemmatimonadales bacterium]
MTAAVPPRRGSPGLALLAGLLIGCGGGEPSGPPPPPTLAIVSGNGQAAEVGTPLPLPVVVSVSNRQGPVGGAAVAFSVETGGGTLSRNQALTDPTGTAAVTWTLGGTMGEQRLRVSAGASVVTVAASASAGAPEIASPTAGNGQFVVVGRPVPIRPRVQVTDRFGNPLPGVPVVFSVGTGGGSITDSTGITDATGSFTLGGWTLGKAPGFNRLQVGAGFALGEFLAVGTPGLLTAADGVNQSANAGTRTPIAPAVLAVDGEGRPLPGVSITFAVTTGGGSVQSADQVTNAQGIARVGGWILGVTPGQNQVEARTPGVPSAGFQALGVAAVPAAIVTASPQTFSGYLGNYLAGVPAVRVTDPKGDPVAGVTVTWQAAGGGTLVQRGAPTTDFDGRAELAGWRLGGTEPSQSVRAAAGPLPEVEFHATAEPLPPPAFRIEVRFNGNQPTAAQRAAFEQAAARWSTLILGDLEDVEVSVPASDFGCYPSLNETIDDLVIFADIVTIDGAGGVLGQAGPCLIRTDGWLSVVGRMRFDVADVTTLEANGRLNDVILHEMGHVLGIGSLWPAQELIQNRGSSDPWFSGPTARAAFLASTGPAGYIGNVVPVENTGGAGTRDAHWRESVAASELMTGFLNTGSNPLSAITVGSLRDQGYLVNDAASDQFSLAAFLRDLGAPALQLREAPLPGPVLVVTRRGGIVRAIQRY